MNLPNKLTIFRVILVPVMVIIPYFNIPGEILGIPLAYLIIDIIFGIASLTDKLDGTIARKYNLVTNFGKFLDPIADKILVLAALIVLVEYKKIPAIIPIIVLFREFAVSGYRLVASQQGGKVIAASFWGKLKTVTQMIAIIAAFLDKFNFGDFVYRVNSVTADGIYMNTFQYLINIFVTVMMVVAVIATIVSGIDYIRKGKDMLKDY